MLPYLKGTGFRRMCNHFAVTAGPGVASQVWTGILQFEAGHHQRQMGQQPGIFCHVTPIDLGGRVKYKGETQLIATALPARVCCT